MTGLDHYRGIVENRHKYAQEWKARTGGRVAGFMCTYMPEEVLYAAGVLPVRIMGSHEPQDITDRYIFPTMWCAYCRDCLAQGLQGRYDYLDGLVIAWCCQHIRQSYDSWLRHAPVGFSYEMYIPNSLYRPSARACVGAETRELARAVAEWTGRPISDESLERAVEVFNSNRRLLRQLYELRKADNPPITGAQAMDMVLSGMVMDKAEHNKLLAETLAGLEEASGGTADDLPRLLLLGSECDDRDIVDFVESIGARVVVDEHCNGTRYFWGDVNPNGDMLSAIANRYVDRPPCPHKDVTSPQHLRLDHVLDLARQWRVQGAVIVQQKFCDPYRYEMPKMEAMLRENGIPTVMLEAEFTLPTGQFRTRVEAFLETIQQEML
ncbi:MAG: 2-hydroxyacyl-CoA dehydratase [Dehalococcoidia bacterium]|nr:2-hydroxyacyl-CoA dehydratase [Dehalococcoidia bacterium]